MHRTLWLIATLGYSLFLAYVSLIRDSRIPETGVDYDDKIFHIIAYGLLCWFWYKSFSRWNSMRPLRYAIMVAIIYGIVLEVLQHELTLDRKLDGFDVIANIIGVTIVSVFIVQRDKSSVKNL